MEKNMTKTLKFIHVMILFLSLFLVTESFGFFEGTPCKTPAECPQSLTHKYLCLKEECFCYYIYIKLR